MYIACICVICVKQKTENKKHVRFFCSVHAEYMIFNMNIMLSMLYGAGISCNCYIFDVVCGFVK